MEMDERKEPTLRDLLAAPLTRLLMASDGVDPGEVEALFDRVRDRFDMPRED
jgi:hypothetical protein